jgi:hypothetical protein
MLSAIQNGLDLLLVFGDEVPFHALVQRLQNKGGKFEETLRNEYWTSSFVFGVDIQMRRMR